MKFEHGGKEYGLIYNLNVMERIQETYGSIDKWARLVMNKKEPNIKALIAGITFMLSEYAEIENERRAELRDGDLLPVLTHKQTSRLFSSMGTSRLFELVDKAIDEAGGDEEKNE